MKNNENLKDNTILASDAEQPTTEQPTSNPGTAPEYLPAGYLANGYYATTEKGAKYLRPEFVGKYAETMATLLADMQITDFNRLVREMKRSKKKTLPFEGRLTAVSEMLPKPLPWYTAKKPRLCWSALSRRILTTSKMMMTGLPFTGIWKLLRVTWSLGGDNKCPPFKSGWIMKYLIQ